MLDKLFSPLFLLILIEVKTEQNLDFGKSGENTVRDWKVSELESVRIHFYAKLESVRIGKCQNWKVSESESVRIEKCQNC